MLHGSPPAAADSPPHVLLHEGPTALIACVDDCLITVVHTLTQEGVAAIARGMTQLVQRHGAFRSLALAVRKTGSEAVDESRAAVAQLVQQHTRSIRAAAVVSEGTGFRATAVRSMVTAIHMAGRASHPTKMFDTLPPALEWLASKRPELPLDGPRVASTVDALRARLSALADGA